MSGTAKVMYFSILQKIRKTEITQLQVLKYQKGFMFAHRWQLRPTITSFTVYLGYSSTLHLILEVNEVGLVLFT